MNISRDLIPTNPEGCYGAPVGDPGADMEDTAAAQCSQREPINILIVDDEPKNLTVLETVLSDPGYRLVRAESPERALMELIAHEFALLILDVRMPGMTGFELAQMIKKRRKTAQIPIIFLTAYFNENEHMMEGYGTGAVDYLLKPVNPAALRSKVFVFADLHRKNREVLQANSALTAEILEKRKIEEELRQLNDNLEQRVAERTQELRHSEERVRLALDAAELGSWNFDPLTKIFSSDERFRSIFGIEAGEISFEEMMSAVHPDDRGPVRDAIAAATRAESPVPYAIEHRVIPPDGSIRWVSGKARANSSHPVAGRSILSLDGTIADITDRKRAEEHLRRANQDLEQFAFSAAHDLQEPLRNIALSSKLLSNRYRAQLDDTADEFLSHMVEGAQRMGALISGLLAFKEAVSLDPEIASGVDAEAVLERIMPSFGSAMAECGAIVTHDPLPWVQVAGVHMEQILRNLIGNSIKYRKEGSVPHIHVSARRESRQWRFLVSDDGIGIAPEYHEQVFGMFKRLHPKGGKYSGTGIGLSICQKTVERYGGRIWIESLPGEGTTVGFTLPGTFGAANG